MSYHNKIDWYVKVQDNVKKEKNTIVWKMKWEQKKMEKLGVDIFPWSSKNWFSFVVYVSTKWFTSIDEWNDEGLLYSLQLQTSKNWSWFLIRKYVCSSFLVFLSKGSGSRIDEIMF